MTELNRQPDNIFLSTLDYDPNKYQFIYYPYYPYLKYSHKETVYV